ncbi:MAG: urease accessory protein UreE [Pararhodobacter sp.]
MTEIPCARSLARAGAWHEAAASVALNYEGRLLRRKRLQTDAGWAFLVDLPMASGLNHGDALLLDDGRAVAIKAAPEPVLVVRGALPRLAWHIGNRHTPCQIGPDQLVIRADHVLEAMLRQLGAEVHEAIATFTPEGGAYGHGRTMGHDHGHDHGQEHGHHRHGRE